MKTQFAPALIAALALSGASLHAQTIDIKDAWIRSSVHGQMATGAFMKITAQDSAQLVAAASPVAGVVEVHEMKMDGDVMRMRAVPALALPAGKTVELKPGGYHIMMMDLKTALKSDTVVPLTLTFKDAKGVERTMVLQVPVQAMAPGAAAQGHGMKH